MLRIFFLSFCHYKGLYLKKNCIILPRCLLFDDNDLKSVDPGKDKPRDGDDMIGIFGEAEDGMILCEAYDGITLCLRKGDIII